MSEAQNGVKGQANGHMDGNTKDHANDHTSGNHTTPEYDCLIVGAGFGGLYLLMNLRKRGFKCKVYEKGTDIGGTWHWNCYPGARTDSEVPVYQFSMEESWEAWTWEDKFPAVGEIRKYFDHLDHVYDLRKDIEFERKMVGGKFDQDQLKWIIKTEDGLTTRCRFLLLCPGSLAKNHVPDFPGLQTFKGEIHHSSSWPQSGVDVRGRRAAIIGTGATGVQIIQEWAKEAGSLVVFQRTPNLALPMNQRKLTQKEQEASKWTYPQFFLDREKTFGCFPYDFVTQKTFEATPEEREAFFEQLWSNGGFQFWLAAYSDLLFDIKANRVAYDFWVKKTRPRVHDPRKRDILAPLEPFHPFGTKRPSLETDYFEMFNKPNVDVVNLRESTITEFMADGVMTSDGKFHPIDVLALATGFDAGTGGLTQLGLRSTDGCLLADEWKDGVYTYLGMTRRGYPNMFYLYGAQGPTAFGNGPCCAEVQGEWIVNMLEKIRTNGYRTVEPTAESEQAWKEKVNAFSDLSLFPGVDSWYMGANIPGKKREQLNYTGGIPTYKKEIRKALEDWVGFATT